MSRTRDQILESRRKLKEYGALFDSISNLLYRHDPIGINFRTTETRTTQKRKPSYRDWETPRHWRTFITRYWLLAVSFGIALCCGDAKPTSNNSGTITTMARQSESPAFIREATLRPA